MWRYINCKCLFAINHCVWQSFVNDCERLSRSIATMGRQKGFPQIPMGNSWQIKENWTTTDPWPAPPALALAPNINLITSNASTIDRQ